MLVARGFNREGMRESTIDGERLMSRLVGSGVLTAFALSLVTRVLIPEARASLVFPESFEAAAGRSDLVILGRVDESPEFGVADNGSGVLRRHRVKVEQLLKGTSGDDVAVYT